MQRFKNILFVADGSTGEEAVLSRAADLAVENGAALTVFDAVDAGDDSLSDASASSVLLEIREALLKGRREELRGLSEAVRAKHPELRLSVNVQAGSTARSAIVAVLNDRHDLVVKAPEGLSLKTLFGSTDQKLMRKCPCPVWIVKPSHEEFKKILAAVDFDSIAPGSESLAKKILALATSLSVMEGSELHVVHVWRLAGEAKLRGGQIDMQTVENLARDMQATHQAGLDALLADFPYDKTEVHLLKGDAADVISECVEDWGIDLVVIGTVARAGIPGLLIGNTAEKVLNDVDCSVLTLKPEGFETPIES